LIGREATYGKTKYGEVPFGNIPRSGSVRALAQHGTSAKNSQHCQT